MSHSRPLAEVGVLVTRPADQAGGFARRLADLGARPLIFPALEIQATTRPEALADALAGLPESDLAIFISPTAVTWGLAALAASSAVWPPGVALAAVGPGTANALAERDLGPVLAPAGEADSEALLALPQLADLTGKRILVFRGEGGRETLAEGLTARGARVGYAECYRRGRPAADPRPLTAALATDRIQAVTVFSAETLDNLLAMLPDADRPALLARPLFAPHPRIAGKARQLGFAAALATQGGEAGVLAGLVEYFAHGRHPA
ncbi:MAG: uroporphyrinogen-III synthase [Pseudomonadota bacterium]